MKRFGFWKKSYVLALVLTTGVAVAESNAVVEEASSMVKETYSHDKNRGSWGRAALLKPEDLEGEAKRVHSIVTAPGSRYENGLIGPLAMWLYSPPVLEHVYAAGTYLRFGTDKDQRLTELIILTTARELSNEVQWVAHERLALKAGLEPEVIGLIEQRVNLEDAKIAGLGEREEVLIRFAREVISDEKLSQATYDRAKQVFGEEGVMEIAGLIGYYSFVNITIKTFDIQFPASYPSPSFK